MGAGRAPELSAWWPNLAPRDPASPGGPMHLRYARSLGPPAGGVTGTLSPANPTVAWARLSPAGRRACCVVGSPCAAIRRWGAGLMAAGRRHHPDGRSARPWGDGRNDASRLGLSGSSG